MTSHLTITQPRIQTIHIPGFAVSGILPNAYGHLHGVLIDVKSGKHYSPSKNLPLPTWAMQFDGLTSGSYFLAIRRGWFRRLIAGWRIDILLPRPDAAAPMDLRLLDVGITAPGGDSIPICPSNFVPYGTSNQEGHTITGTLTPEAGGKKAAQQTTVTGGIWSFQFMGLTEGALYTLDVDDGTSDPKRYHLKADSTAC